MKIIIIVILSLVNFVVVYSQQTGYISGNASANLIQPLSIEAKSGDLDFGNIIVTESNYSAKIEPKLGKLFVVTGHPGKNITVRFNSVELTNYEWASKYNGKLDRLTFIPKVELKSTQQISDGTNIPLIKNGQKGELQIFVGGEINIKPKQEVGDYTGLFILSVTY